MSQKNKKVQLSTLQALLILVGTIVASVSLTLFYIVGQNSIQQAATPGQSVVLPDRLVHSLERSYALLKNLYIEDLDENKLIDGALNGFVAAAGDDYTNYLNVDAMKSLQDVTDSSFQGVGVEMEKDGDYFRVVTPIENSPAQKAGLQTYDYIIKVDDRDVKGLSASEVAKLVRGPKGTPVTLTLRRAQSEFKVTITRDTIDVKTVTYQLSETNKTIGVIRLTSFAKNSYDEMVHAIQALREQGAKAFVLDVRSNPGGLLDVAQEIISLFVEEDQVIFQLEDKQHGVQKVTSSKQAISVTEPVTVLINEGSASASEVLAGALSDIKQTTLVGVKSFGKGTAQTIQNLTKDTGIKITFSKWLTPNGTWVHKKGIEPNISITLPYSDLPFLNIEKTYSENMVDTTVANIQTYLNALGYTLEVTGVYNQATVQQVKAFQKAQQLSESGQVDSETATRLMSALRQKVKAEDAQLQKAVEVTQSQLQK